MFLLNVNVFDLAHFGDRLVKISQLKFFADSVLMALIIGKLSSLESLKLKPELVKFIFIHKLNFLRTPDFSFVASTSLYDSIRLK